MSSTRKRRIYKINLELRKIADQMDREERLIEQGLTPGSLSYEELQERRERAGERAQQRTVDLVALLERWGDVAWYQESKKGDDFDRQGIDIWGELSDRHRNLAFRVDAKSSLVHLREDQMDRLILIFVPDKKEPSDKKEAERLLVEIKAFFGD